MKNKPNNIIRIPSSDRGRFFRLWFEFLKPFHNLTSREMDMAAAFLNQRYRLSKVISDPEILNRELMGEAVKKEIREECGISPQHFQVIMGKLRKSKVIENGRLNPRFIPNMTDDSEPFTLLLSFEINGGNN